MAFKTHFKVTTQTFNLFTDYMNYNRWWEIKKRRTIKKEIYSTELPIIRKQLLEINDFEELLDNQDFSRIYMNAFYESLSNKNLSLTKLTQITNPNSLYHRFINFQLKLLYNLLISERISYVIVEKIFRMLNTFNRGYFIALTNTNLDVFSYFEILDKERNKKLFAKKE